MANVTINQLPVASTIDPANDYLPIFTASSTSTQGINRNTFLGLSSAPVGLTDTQTLTNKTLTSPTISGPTFSGTLAGTYTIGGTPTFPAAITQNAATQTLTNKTLTSPTINSPTITNATINADAITGFTVSNSGTIYGISVTTGTISGSVLANTSVQNAALASGIQSSKFSNPYKFYVYRAAALTFGSPAEVPMDTKIFDTGSNVDVVTNKGRFTAPVNGFYWFNAAFAFNSSGSGFQAYLYKNGSSILQGVSYIQSGAWGNIVTVSGILQLSASDYIEPWFYGSGQAAGVGATQTYFQGFLVSAT